jgi:hypothetical protein
MQREEASDIGCLIFVGLNFNFNQKIHQSINKDMKIALWGVVVSLLRGIDGDNKLELPVATTAKNETSRANNRTIATPTACAFALNQEPNGSATPTRQRSTGHSPLR